MRADGEAIRVGAYIGLRGPLTCPRKTGGLRHAATRTFRAFEIGGRFDRERPPSSRHRRPQSSARYRHGIAPGHFGAARQKRNRPMSTQAKTFVAPHLVCANAADAIEFYKKAFGATEEMRMAGPDGKAIMHACIKINGAPIFLVDENPQWGALSPKSLNGSRVTIHLQVDNVEALFERAVKAGATGKMPPGDMFWGDRYGMLVDPFGHHWSIATHQRDMTEAEIKAAMMAAFAGHGEKG
jgi:uncharacterized glyoxalase superfamily protein PhnB